MFRAGFSPVRHYIESSTPILTRRHDTRGGSCGPVLPMYPRPSNRATARGQRQRKGKEKEKERENTQKQAKHTNTRKNKNHRDRKDKSSLLGGGSKTIQSSQGKSSGYASRHLVRYFSLVFSPRSCVYCVWKYRERPKKRHTVKVEHIAKYCVLCVEMPCLRGHTV